MLKNKNTIVSWTGGKDCALSYFLANELGYNIVGLVSFYSGNQKFKAHSDLLIKKQSEELGINWIKKIIEEPFDNGYESVLEKLKDEHNIEYIITGDIDFIDGHIKNYMVERCENIGLKVFNPIWKNLEMTFGFCY